MKIFYHIQTSCEDYIDEVVITFIAAENLNEAEKIALENNIIRESYLKLVKLGVFEPFKELKNVSYCGEAGVIETIIR